MGRRLEGKTAVITGGTSGIGKETVSLFIEEGAKVVFCGRDDEKGQSLEKGLGENAAYCHADVTVEADIANLITFAKNRLGCIDCLFNNAGGPSRGTLETVTPEDFRYSMDLLLGAPVFGIKHIAPIMKAQKSGSIINNASIAALRMNQGGYLYSAAKAAVIQLTVFAGTELGPHGIRVNSISPGAIATPVFWGGSQRARTLPSEENERKLDKLTKNLANATALNQAGLPMDIAQAALFLASDEGRFITCHDLVVDGGRIALFYEKPRE